MPAAAPATISTLSASALEPRLAELGRLLHACVHARASIGFILPFTEPEAEAFWRTKVLPPVRAGARTLWIAEQTRKIVGTVQLSHDTPANQPHRAEVSKLLVHPTCRRQGIARSLMAALHLHARTLGRTLLTLDTRTGDTAEPLYTSLGYQTAGTIPGYCLDPVENRLDSTTVMYKPLNN